MGRAEVNSIARALRTYKTVLNGLAHMRLPTHFLATASMQSGSFLEALTDQINSAREDDAAVISQSAVRNKLQPLIPFLRKISNDDDQFQLLCDALELADDIRARFKELLLAHKTVWTHDLVRVSEVRGDNGNDSNSDAEVPLCPRLTLAQHSIGSQDEAEVAVASGKPSKSNTAYQRNSTKVREVRRSEAFVRYLIEFASDTAIDECDIWLDHPELIPLAANRLSETLLDVLEVLSLRPDLIEIVQWKTLGTHRVVNAILGLDEHQKIDSVRGRQLKQRLKELDRIAQTGLLVFDAVTKYMDLSDRNREDFKRFMIESGRLSLPAPSVPPTFDFSFQNAFKQPLFAITWINDANHNEAEPSAGYWSGNFYGGIVVSYEVCDGFAQQFNCGSLAEKLNTIYRGLPESLQLHIVSASFLEKRNLIMGQHYLVDASLREVFYSLADTHGLTAKQVCAKIGQDCLLWLSLDERLPGLVETAHQREHESVQQRRRTTMPNANDLKQLREFSDLLLLFVHLTLLDFGFTLVQIEWILRVLQQNYDEMRKRSRLTYDESSDSSSDDQSIWSSQRTLSNESVPQSPSAREEQFPSRSNDDISFRPPGHLASRCVLGSDQSLASSCGQIQEPFRQEKSQRVILREIRTGPASPKKWTL